MSQRKCIFCGKTKGNHYKDKNDSSLYCNKKSPYGLRFSSSTSVYTPPRKGENNEKE